MWLVIICSSVKIDTCKRISLTKQISTNAYLKMFRYFRKLGLDLDTLELSNWTLNCHKVRLTVISDQVHKFDFLLLWRSRIVQWTRGIGVEVAISDYEQQKSHSVWVHYICPNFKMYLPKLQNIFVQIATCICLNFKTYLSKLGEGGGRDCDWRLPAAITSLFVRVHCICLNCKIYFSKLLNVFV